MATTAKGTPYVESSDLVADYPTVSLALAEHIDDFGGKVLQVVTATHATQVQTTSATFVDSNLTATITPVSTSNKIAVFVVMPLMTYVTSGTQIGAELNIVRTSTQIRLVEVFSRIGASNIEIQMEDSVPMQVVDSPNSIAAVTYKVQGRVTAGSFIRMTNNDYVSSITLIEVSA